MQGFSDALKESDPATFAEEVGKLAPAARDTALAVRSLAPVWSELRLDIQQRLFAGLGTTTLPSVGMTGVLVIVIGYLLVANHRDRTSYERAMRRRDAEHAAELASARTAHDADLVGLRSRLSSLEQRLEELETELDRERDRRRRAEDDAAAALRHT
jgi:hypothetical protein